jgi:hypothetical protein
MLQHHDLESIQYLIENAESFERDFMRDYAQMEIDIIRHQGSRRSLTQDENRAFEFAIEILARLETVDRRADPMFTCYRRNELRKLYLNTH